MDALAAYLRAMGLSSDQAMNISSHLIGTSPQLRAPTPGLAVGPATVTPVQSRGLEAGPATVTPMPPAPFQFSGPGLASAAAGWLTNIPGAPMAARDPALNDAVHSVRDFVGRAAEGATHRMLTAPPPLSREEMNLGAPPSAGGGAGNSIIEYQLPIGEEK
jgi:hypothetical protein